jgi:hypothetical protein
MRISSLITTLNPMTETTKPARLIQSPALIVTGSSVLITDKGARVATFALTTCDEFLGAKGSGVAEPGPMPTAPGLASAGIRSRLAIPGYCRCERSWLRRRRALRIR